MQPNYRYKAIITNVVDGDTVDAVIDVGFDMTVHKRLRLLGIDTPERGQDGFHEATVALSDLLAGEEILVETKKADSFGRYLANLYTPVLNINQWMLDQGYAKPYTR